MSSLKVAFVLGEGYSGSTLLDLILGSHSRTIGLGEIDPEAFDTFLEKNQLCTCLFRSKDCSFWHKVLDRLSGPGASGLFRLATANSDPDTTLDRTLELFQAVQDVSSAEMLVDSSKQFQRACVLTRSGRIRPKIIHLVRDGRGVAYSYFRRGVSFGDAVLNWKNKNAEIASWLLGAGAPENITVRYEDLCSQPAAVTRRLCEFLDLEWEPQMMRYGQKVHHNVRGSTMRFLIDRSPIKYDDTWKKELPEQELVLFDQLAGRFSRQLGYA